MRSSLLSLLAGLVLSCSNAWSGPIFYDFSGTCAFECGPVGGPINGYLELNDGYVPGAAISAVDFARIKFTGPVAFGEYVNPSFLTVVPTGVPLSGSGVILQLQDLRDPQPLFAGRYSLTAGANAQWLASWSNGTTFSQIDSMGLTLRQANVPIPATLALFGIGLAGLGWSRRKKA